MEHGVIFFQVLLLGLFSQSEGPKHWRSAKAEVTAIQGESATLAWSINLTDSDVNKTWTYVKIIHAKGPYTEELVTFEKTGKKTIENPSYSSRISDMTFNVSQSGSAVNIRFTMTNLVRATDMKSYKAMLGFNSDASTYPDVTILTILVKPHSNELKIKPEKNTYCLGDKVIVTCKADGIPPPQISLFLNGKLIQSENTSVAVTLSLNVKGEKNLDCVTNNTAGIGQTSNVKLVVKEPPKIGLCRINDEEVTTKSVIEGTKVIITCEVAGSEPLGIAWYKQNVQTPLSGSKTLTFDSIHRRDSGQYRVKAYNGRECEHTAPKILHVTVMYLDEPQVLGKKYKVFSPSNPKVHFKVNVDGYPRPNFTCRREGGSGSSFTNVSIAHQVPGSKWILSVYIFATADEKYYCDVRNDAFNRLIKFKVYKQGPPKKINGTFILTNASWSENLKNPSSGAYFKLNTKINQTLELVYANEEFVTAWRILSFVNRKGSVGVNFQLDVIANVTDPIILLKHAVDKNGGKLNGLSIDRNSIKTGYLSPPKDGETAGKATESDNKTGMYVGIAVGIFVLLVLSLATLWFYSKRRGERVSDRRSNESTDNAAESLLDISTPTPAAAGKERKAPHCKTCHEPMKGHKKGKCSNSPQGGNVTFERTIEKCSDGTTTTTGRVTFLPDMLERNGNQ
ncbi:hemicentin-1-like isoform X2 [Actinia tenebrosa]|uniref:Hemicentin-1-like isoform X2 n=1 Tax=Actinia tenebrosa TaxID=6105 RepID=A0A6P8IZA3_ACTTE|nr:hemicentin-1-like isoform X2 [Actinia tenebrosa]